MTRADWSECFVWRTEDWVRLVGFIAWIGVVGIFSLPVGLLLLPGVVCFIIEACAVESRYRSEYPGLTGGWKSTRNWTWDNVGNWFGLFFAGLFVIALSFIVRG